MKRARSAPRCRFEHAVPGSDRAGGFANPLGGPDATDLTRQHAAAPLGERIIVQGRVLDEDGNPVPGTLLELWRK